jgi:protein-disulfide isomerase
MRFIPARFAVIALTVLSLAACAKGGGQVTSDDMSMGNDKAPVTMIEYASASCPHCAEFNNDVFPAFKAKYIDTGKVHYVFREFLTPPEDVAAAGFMTARCAGRDKYFSVLDAIYHGQHAMFLSGDIHGALLRIAESAGLNETQFNTCINDAAGLKALNDRVQTYIDRDKINGTPTFVINGKTLNGEHSMADLDKAVAAAQAGK